MQKENQWHDVEVDVVVTYRMRAVWGPTKEEASARVKDMIVETIHVHGDMLNEEYSRAEVVRSYVK